ncbi:MAG TPA: hypothetical protein EYP60_01255 [bacterium (Candidatus Stahlbacteria)]|nr:hypothetical protein [Candidatus Stahlbacteria bacterium]
MVAVLLALVALFLQHAYAGLEPGKSQIQTYTWFRYTAKAEPGEFTKLDANYFGLERSYLRWEHAFTDKIKSRVNVDLFSSDKDPHGAGLKLKYGYVDFNVIPEGKITVGLQKSYWGTIYDWKYVTIEKALEDKEKIIASADYGVTVNANIVGGMGEWQLGIYNGEGYKKYKSKVDKYPAFVGNIRFIPVPGLTIGGSALYEKKKESQRLLMASVGRIARGPIDVWGEIIMAKTGNPEITGVGVMVMPILKLNRKLELVGRADYWDKDIDIKKNAHYRTIAGFNYHFVKRKKGKPGVMLQVNLERKQCEYPDKKAENALLVQLRWEFATNSF